MKISLVILPLRVIFVCMASGKQFCPMVYFANTMDMSYNKLEKSKSDFNQQYLDRGRYI